jgi:hypothetical protein
MTKALYAARGQEITIADAQNALAFPPVNVGDVSAWNGDATKDANKRFVIGAFDFEVYAAAAVDLTNAELFGTVQYDLTIASDDVDTVDFANDELDITTHGLDTGHGPIQFTTTGTLPTGMALETDYYVINIGAGTIQIAASLEDAIEGTAVSFSDVGSGTHSLLGSAGAGGASYEIRHLNYGFLGPANDGAISLAAQEGYTTRVNHRPRTVLYSVSATLSSAVAVTIKVFPIQEKP